MKIQHILLFLVAVGLLYYFFPDMGNQFKTDFKNVTLTDEGVKLDSIYTFSNQNNLLLKTSTTTDRIYETDDVILSTQNRGAIKVGSAPISDLLKSRTIKLNIVIDSNLVDDSIDINKGNINKVLARLNSGIQVEWDNVQYMNFNDIETKGTINTNRLSKDLKSNEKWNVYLFEQSDFFNTANAVAIKVKNEKDSIQNFILGNAYLLESPYLFAHELFHGLGLTHYNGMYNDCGTGGDFRLSNVMNESNIGCSRRLSARQIMMINGQAYFKKLDKDIIFPEDENCECHFKGLGGHVEQYLNSFDRNLDDTPLIGDDEELLNYVEYLKTDILPSNLETLIKKNYAAEAAEAGILDSDYVAKRIAGHRKLRLYNLTRWIKENAEMKGIEVDSNIWEMDGNTLGQLYANYVDKTVEQLCKKECLGGCPTIIDDKNVCNMCTEKGEVKEEEITRTREGRPNSQYKSTQKLLNNFYSVLTSVEDDPKDIENDGGINGDGTSQEQESTGTTNQGGEAGGTNKPNQPDKPNQPEEIKDNKKKNK